MKNLIKFLLLGVVLFFGISIFLLSHHIGGFRAFTVMSGSMEPAIGTGSLVITKSIHPDNLKLSDVITFIRPSRDREFITHRIVDLSKSKDLTIVKTRGDHNNSNDPWVLAGGGVVGKVVASIPALGYILSFTKTKIGIALFILIPSVIIIYMEISNIFNLIKFRKARTFIAREGQTLFILLPISMILSGHLQPTSALLSDSANLTVNKFTVVSKPDASDCGEDTNIEISDNGAGSNNTVDVSSNCMTVINQTNNTSVNNAINTVSYTGNNIILNTTSHNSTAITGNINTNISVTTKEESNFAGE
ncbi:MAG TPA: signal peptidase I [Candidatus Limnocylindrales bacterium]|nr:signal peptidase I [Candidatus Limnocylindrales bacterium]